MDEKQQELYDIILKNFLVCPDDENRKKARHGEHCAGAQPGTMLAMNCVKKQVFFHIFY